MGGVRVMAGWALLLTVLCAIFTILLYGDGRAPLLEVFGLVALCVYINGLLPAGVLEWLLHRRAVESLPRMQSTREFILPLALAIAVGSCICVPLVGHFFSPGIYGAFWKLALAVPLISVLVAGVATQLRVATLPVPSPSPPLATSDRLWLRIDGALQGVHPGDIHYISARRHSSVLHTVHGDWQAAPGLSELLRRLEAVGAQSFVRAHRSFVLNVECVQRLEHLGGGVYRATLGDDTESEVPVGRRFVSAVRARLA